MGFKQQRALALFTTPRYLLRCQEQDLQAKCMHLFVLINCINLNYGVLHLHFMFTKKEMCGYI